MLPLMIYEYLKILKTYLIKSSINTPWTYHISPFIVFISTLSYFCQMLASMFPTTLASVIYNLKLKTKNKNVKKQHFSHTLTASIYINRDEAVWQSNMFVHIHLSNIFGKHSLIKSIIYCQTVHAFRPFSM